MSDRSFASILLVFLKLGLTSFGGPIAHLGYFRAELVERRKWIDETTYAELVALCQFLPGPASSQVGFAAGLTRGGLLGGLAAWLGFTLPSALALVLFAYGAPRLTGPLGAGMLQGLKLVAVAVVAHAVWTMAQSLCPDRERASIAAAAALIVLLAGTASSQIMAMVLGAGAGLWLYQGRRNRESTSVTGALVLEARGTAPVPRSVGLAALAAFAALLILLPVAARHSHWLAVAESFYRSGALVFGGGHVVLPLLQAAVVEPGWVTRDSFLAGYGAAQAVPGPLFTFAAYLGAVMAAPPTGWVGALLCLIAVFLPGLLLVAGALPFWQGLRRYQVVQSAVRGVNAAVVGVLLAALFDPVWTSAVKGPRDFAVALVAFVLLAVWRVPPWIGVAFAAAAGALLTLG